MLQGDHGDGSDDDGDDDDDGDGDGIDEDHDKDGDDHGGGAGGDAWLRKVLLTKHCHHFQLQSNTFQIKVNFNVVLFSGLRLQ